VCDGGSRFTPDGQMRLTTLMSAQAQRWVQFGTVQSAGSAWDWFVRLFGGRSSAERLQWEAAQVRAGSDGLLFLPYLSGERAPIWNPQAKGVFFGLQAHHTRGHLARAVLEGVACALASILQVMHEHGAVAESVRVVGGGTRNEEWMRILADMYGCPIEIPQHAETSTALGAAVIAGVAVGVYESFAIAKQIAAPARRVEPRNENVVLYRYLRERFGELYEAVKGMYR
jgi:xylulokinase